MIKRLQSAHPTPREACHGSRHQRLHTKMPPSVEEDGGDDNDDDGDDND